MVTGGVVGSGRCEGFEKKRGDTGEGKTQQNGVLCEKKINYGATSRIGNGRRCGGASPHPPVNINGRRWGQAPPGVKRGPQTCGTEKLDRQGMWGSYETTSGGVSKPSVN